MAKNYEIEWAKNVASEIAHMPEVVKEVNSYGRKMARRAEALLLTHKKTGNHEIEIGQGITDTVVSLTGRAPWAVEFGHRAPNGQWVPGIFVLTRAYLGMGG